MRSQTSSPATRSRLVVDRNDSSKRTPETPGSPRSGHPQMPMSGRLRPSIRLCQRQIGRVSLVERRVLVAHQRPELRHDLPHVLGGGELDVCLTADPLLISEKCLRVCRIDAGSVCGAEREPLGNLLDLLLQYLQELLAPPVLGASANSHDEHRAFSPAEKRVNAALGSSV
jgi:hypothetical protein